MARTVFSVDGLELGKANRNWTYLYGLSDFWQFIFEDTEKMDLLMEANSQKLSDVYSKFLQLTSTISIADIEVATHQQIKLVIIKDTDEVEGKVNTFTLQETILKSRLIANRPFLPTAYLEEEIHYHISEDGSEIQFFEPIHTIGFPSRVLSDDTKEYSLWMVDSLVDEQMIFQFYGKLIGADAQTSTENYKNFIYGLYYLYTNGPSLDAIRKGLNLTLGIPLARETETVIETRKYLDTDQWLVITDLNSYLIPYGLEPSVAVGDVLYATQELAQWVEVKDWINDGTWWINLAIPAVIMPHIPAGETSRFATAGSYADFLMANFLKNHTFLVKVKTIDFKNIQSFEELSDIIRKAKPTYTYPIYIWTPPTPEEIIHLDDEDLFLRWDNFRCENLSIPINVMFRDADEPLTRGCAQFSRRSVPDAVSSQMGESDEVNLEPRDFNGEGDVTGFINVPYQFRANTDSEKAWFRTFLNSDNESFRPLRSMMIFNRSMTFSDDSGQGVRAFVQPDPTKRVVFLYATTQADLTEKFATIGNPPPSMSDWVFTLFQPTSTSNSGINTIGINEAEPVNFFPVLESSFSTFFFRGVDVNYLGNFMPRDCYNTYAPDVSDLDTEDYLLFVRVYENTVGVYWVTGNQTVDAPDFWVSKTTDPIEISSDDTPFYHGVGFYSGASYLRGQGITVTPVGTSTIGELLVGGSPLWTDDTIVDVEYEDHVNTPPVVMDRSGIIIKIKRTWY